MELPSLVIWILISRMGIASGYANGQIPSSACSSMTPSHSSHSAQSSAAPYELVVSASGYAGSDTLTVTLTTSAVFLGFFVQARSASDDTTRIGSFSSTPASQTRCSDEAASHANDDEKTSVTLTWTAPSSAQGDLRFRATVVQSYNTFWTEVYSSVITASAENDVTVTPSNDTTPTEDGSEETAPVTSEQFSTNTVSNSNTQLTMTQSHTTSPTPEPSSPITLQHELTSAPSSVTPVTDSLTTGDVSAGSTGGQALSTAGEGTGGGGASTLPEQTTDHQNTGEDFSIDLDACGDTRGCFRRPSGCDADDCDAAVLWKPREDDEDYVEFEMQADSDGWVALGFSEDSSMGDDYVLMCIRDGGTVSVVSSFNDGYSHGEFDDSDYGISSVSTYYSDGTIKCKCRRQIDASTVSRRRRRRSDSSNFFDIDERYTLFLGVGPASGGSAGQHVDTPYVSDGRVRVTTSTDDVGAKALNYDAYKAHGILMIVVWLLGICWSFIVTRFFKPAFAGKKICETDIWFFLHRAINIGCFVVFMVSFILIFIEVEGYTEIGEADSDYLKAHAPLGIIVAGLFCANPIVALFRPKPDHAKRPIWNWIHWVIGYGAQILAIIVIIIGFDMPKATKFIDDADRSWVRALAIVLLCLYALTWIVLEIQRLQQKKSDSNCYAEDTGMEMKAPTSPDEPQQMNSKGKVNILSFVILVVYMVISVALCVAIIIGISTADTD